MRKGFTKSTSSRWNADTSELTSSWPSNSSQVKFILARQASSSAHPEPGYEGTLADCCKDQAIFDARVVPFRFRSWNTGTDAGTSSLVTISIYLQKPVGPSMVQNFSCSTCVISFPIHWHFSLWCCPRLYLFSLTPNPRPAYVVITGPRGHSYH